MLASTLNPEPGSGAFFAVAFIMLSHARLVAHGYSLELEFIRVLPNEFGARFCHREHSPLGLKVHQS